jgi:hypothetical protein
MYFLLLYNFSLSILIVRYVPVRVFRLIVLFCVLFVCKCVLYYCHRVSTQLQLKINKYIYIYMWSQIVSLCIIHNKSNFSC